jgi:ferredoxin
VPHIINPKECAVCGACEANCPTGAVSIHESCRYYMIDPKLCTDCGECAQVCPTEAITAAERQADAERLSPP